MPRRLSAAVLALVPLVALGACQAPVQQGPQPDTGSGAVFYRATCATCHEGGGVGPAPDLTRLSALNGGTFPIGQVTRIIDGRAGLRAHGSPMPVWGGILTQAEVRNLAAYIASIQQ